MAPAAVDANDQVHMVDVEVTRNEFSADYGRLEPGDVVEMEVPQAVKWVRLGIGKSDDIKGTEKTTGRVRRARQEEVDQQASEEAAAAQYSSMIGGGQAGRLMSRMEARIADLEARLAAAEGSEGTSEKPKATTQRSGARGTPAQRRAQEQQQSKSPASMTVGDAPAEGGPAEGEGKKDSE